MRAVGMGFLGAFILGLLGLVIGFFGPILFSPNSNQGPLFGIFVSGPAGIILGFVGGLIYGLSKNK